MDDLPTSSRNTGKRQLNSFLTSIIAITNFQEFLLLSLFITKAVCPRFIVSLAPSLAVIPFSEADCYHISFSHYFLDH